VRARIEGTLRELEVFADSRDALTTILDHAALGPVGSLPRQGVLSLTDDERTVDLAASALPTRLGVQVTLRVPDRAGPPSSLSELGLGSSAEAFVREALRRPCGAVVVCGPVVSGRTTTLYALLRELTAPERAVATIEAPIHRLAPGTSQVEASAGDLSFASGLRAVLYSDPDVVLVGDLGDAETARVAFRAARADRLVLTALEAPTASSAVTRLAELGVEPHLLSSTLSCVVAQHLVRRVCADCRETYYASAEEIAKLGRPDEESGRRLLARGRGCTSCSGTGYRGYAAVFEILPLTERARSLIADGVAASTIRDAAVEDGMTTLLDGAVGLCLDGVTTASEVLQVAVD
jgi:type II secretory ATPase GspE/PulE/Tfp pilus assembly ATPase PilB-like protein